MKLNFRPTIPPPVSLGVVLRRTAAATISGEAPATGGAAPAAGAFFNDQFTGPAGLLTAHPSNSAHSWIGAPNMYFAAGGTTTHLKINGSGLLTQDVAGAVVQSAAVAVMTPPAADYEVEFRCKPTGVVGTQQLMVVAGRYIEATGDGYLLSTFPQDATTVRVELDTGVMGTIIDSNDHTVVDATDYILKLSMIGTAIKVYLDTVLIITATNAEIAAANSIGVLLGPDATGSANLDYITATQIGP